jgi:hypothetical protein
MYINIEIDELLSLYKYTSKKDIKSLKSFFTIFVSIKNQLEKDLNYLQSQQLIADIFKNFKVQGTPNEKLPRSIEEYTQYYKIINTLIGEIQVALSKEII